MQDAEHLVQRVEEAIDIRSHPVVEMDCFRPLEFITLVIIVVNHSVLVHSNCLFHQLNSAFVDFVEDPVRLHCLVALTFGCRTSRSLDREDVLVLLVSADLFRELSLKCTEDVIKVGDNHECKEVLGDFECSGFN